MCRGYANKRAYIVWAWLMSCPALRWMARRMFPEMRPWLVVLLLLPMLGCATMLQTVQKPIAQAIIKRGIEYGVIKFLSSEPDKQPVALKVVTYLQDGVDKSAELTVKNLEELAMDEIPWGDMDLEEQYTLRGTIEDISGYLQVKVGEGVLSNQDKVKVGDFLEWLEQAIRFAGSI